MSQQFNVRLPELTHQQITQLNETHGLTKTQVIILAVDRLTNALVDQNTEAQKDLRRLKTVARIVPSMDLGQDD
jgi:Asp-tRNA(Asn)/Glu-tRNA(Gln) amidotransferase B subunit